MKLSSSSEDDRGFLGIVYGNNGVVAFPMLGISVWMPQAKVYLDALKQIPSLLTVACRLAYSLGLPIYGFAGEGIPWLLRYNNTVLSACGLGRASGNRDFLDRKYPALDWLAELLCRAVQLLACRASGRRSCV